MVYYRMEPLYVPQIVSDTIHLDPAEFDAQYEKKIKQKLKNKRGNSCYQNGFVKKSSIELVKIENGRRLGAHLHGFLTFKVKFSALFCIPQADKVIRCRISTLNKVGAWAEQYPMKIIIPRQLQQYEASGLEVFATLKQGDYVYARARQYTRSE